MGTVHARSIIVTCELTRRTKFTLVPVETDAIVWALNALGAVTVRFSAHIAPITRSTGTSVAKRACLAANLLRIRLGAVWTLRACPVDAKVGCVVFLMTCEALHLQNVRRSTWRTEGTTAALACIACGTEVTASLLFIGLFAVATDLTKASVSWTEFVTEAIVAPIGE